VRLKKETITRIFPLIIAATGLILYANSLDGKFIWDDETLVRLNTYTRSFANLPKVFTQDIGHGSGTRLGFYRPIQIMTYTIDYLFYGIKERGYHLTNVFLHILTAICVYWLSNVLYKKRWASLIAAMLFLAHPLHTATVSYISGRADSLVNLFILLGVIFYVKDTDKPSVLSCTAIFISYTLALFSKEGALIFPALLVLYHCSFMKKIRPARFLPVVAITLGYILIRLTALKHLLVPSPETICGSTTILDRLPGSFAAITAYAQTLIMPVDIHMGHGMYLFRPGDPRAISGLLIFAAMIAAAYHFRRAASRNLIFFGIMWFIIAILPVSNIYPLNSYMAEHWLALPSVGLFLIIGNSIVKKEGDDLRGVSPFLVIVVSAAIAFYGYITIWQNNCWSKPLRLYNRILQYEPRNVNVLVELARQYEAMNRPEEAIKLYTRAVEINPKFAIPYNNLGLIYHKMGKDDIAIKYYEKSIELDPDFSIALNNLAGAYRLRGRTAEAIGMYEKAIKANPNFAGAYSNLGLVYGSMGDYGKALEALKKAVEISSDHPQANYNIAVLYYNMRQYDLAVKHCDKAASLGWKCDKNFLDKIESVRSR